MLQSSDHLEATILKMSIGFQEASYVPDVAANICPEWSGALQLDYLQLFKVIERTMRQQPLDHVWGEEEY